MREEGRAGDKEIEKIEKGRKKKYKDINKNQETECRQKNRRFKWARNEGTQIG